MTEEHMFNSEGPSLDIDLLAKHQLVYRSTLTRIHVSQVVHVCSFRDEFVHSELNAEALV